MLRTTSSITLFAGCYLYTLVHAVDNRNLEPLRFNQDGSFKICVFSDMHFAQSASGIGPRQDSASVNVMSNILDYEEPDLVVLNGDLINGEDTYLENSTHYVDQIVAPMVDRELTWASAYGNHDHQYNISGSGILQREQGWTGSRTDSMVNTTNSGVTNYYLPVYEPNCTQTDDCTPEILLWFFDSRGGSYFQGGGQPNWVDSSVVEWFNETNSKLVQQYDKEIPSLAFVHVPVHVTYLLQTENGVDGNRQPGIDEETVVQQGDGWCDESDNGGNCTYGDQDLPFMRALASIPGIIALFYGHDHGNSWCYKWDSQVQGMSITGNGINLCYGQHTGYGGYGDWIRGGRQILVTQEGLKSQTVDTHIRLESGDVVGSVSLNSTYNEDSYETTPNQMTYLSAMGDSSRIQTCRPLYGLLFITSLAHSLWW